MSDFATMDVTSDISADAGLDTASEVGQEVGQEIGTELGNETETEVGQNESTTTEPVAEGETNQLGNAKEIRNAIRAVTAQFPEHAKLLNKLADSHLRVENAYRKAVGTPEEATAIKQLVDSVGGLDGISNLTERVSSYEMQDSALSEGNPEVLDSIFKDFPEGSIKLAPHFLERLAQTNYDSYRNAVTPHAMHLIHEAKLPEFVNSFANETDPTRLQAALHRIRTWINEQTQHSNQLVENYTNSAKNPAVEKLEQERASLNTQKEDIFKSQVTEKINASSTPTLTNEVAKYAKQYRLTPEQKKDYQQRLLNTVVSEMNNDETYKKQINLRYASKNRSAESIAAYASAEFARRIKDKALEAVKIYGTRGYTNPTTTGQVKPTSPATATNGGPMKVSARPDNKYLNLDHPDAAINLIKGRAWTKSGKFISWV